MRCKVGRLVDNTTLTFLAALGGAFLVVIGAIVLASFLNRGAATRESALLSALESERKARAGIEQQRELERVESRKYREETSVRMASMERELIAVKAELAIVKQRGEIERATLMNLLRLKQGGEQGEDGYISDIPEAEDSRLIAWIAKHFRMDGDIELLAANAQFPVVVPPGGIDARANWIVTWARQNGLSGNLSAAAKKMRDKVKPW